MANFADGATASSIRQMLNDTGLRKNNLTALVAPTPTDDSASGYEVGSLWYQAGATLKVLQDDTASAAIWGDVYIPPAQDVVLEYAISDEIVDAAPGTNLMTVRLPHAIDITDIRASASAAPTGQALTVDIKADGVSILSSLLAIDNTEKTSTTSATPVAISTTQIADDAEITFDIVGVGTTYAGAGIKVKIMGTRA